MEGPGRSFKERRFQKITKEGVTEILKFRLNVAIQRGTREKKC